MSTSRNNEQTKGNCHNRYQSIFKKYLRYQDNFGHKINLNFNQEGEYFNSTVGGLASVFIKILLLVFLYVKINRI